MYLNDVEYIIWMEFKMIEFYSSENVLSICGYKICTSKSNTVT